MELEDTEIIVVCELCNNKTPNFNRHMRTHHPGCGGKLASVTLCNLYYNILIKINLSEHD